MEGRSEEHGIIEGVTSHLIVAANAGVITLEQPSRFNDFTQFTCCNDKIYGDFCVVQVR